MLFIKPPSPTPGSRARKRKKSSSSSSCLSSFKNPYTLPLENSSVPISSIGPSKKKWGVPEIRPLPRPKFEPTRKSGASVWPVPELPKEYLESISGGGEVPDWQDQSLNVNCGNPKSADVAIEIGETNSPGGTTALQADSKSTLKPKRLDPVLEARQTAYFLLFRASPPTPWSAVSRLNIQRLDKFIHLFREGADSKTARQMVLGDQATPAQSRRIGRIQSQALDRAKIPSQGGRSHQFANGKKKQVASIISDASSDSVPMRTIKIDRQSTPVQNQSNSLSSQFSFQHSDYLVPSHQQNQQYHHQHSQQQQIDHHPTQHYVSHTKEDEKQSQSSIFSSLFGSSNIFELLPECLPMKSSQSSIDGSSVSDYSRCSTPVSQQPYLTQEQSDILDFALGLDFS